MNQFVIVSFLEQDVPASFRKSEWPLHVTILRPFTTEASADDIFGSLKKVGAQTKSIRTVGKSKELFGEHLDVPVVELTLTPELQALRLRIKTKLETQIEFSAPSFDTFRPHVTDAVSLALAVGDEVFIKAVSLVEIRNDERHVFGTVSFSEQP